MGTLEYSSNNSGGDWWLKDDDWFSLQEAGWEVDWVRDQKETFLQGDANGRWLDALATKASIETDDPDATIAEWEKITGQKSTDEGCSCCGEPHNFYFTDNDGNLRYSIIEVVQKRRVWS